MKKNVLGRKLSRDVNERRALFKTLASSLVMHESITTTEAKAKAIKPYVEKLVTKAKRRSTQARQFIEPNLSKEATDKLLADTALRFADRNGGYTRIIKMGNRFADNAPVVKIEWVDKTPLKIEKKAVSKKTKKTSLKPQAKTTKKSVAKKTKTVKKNEK